MKIILRHPLGKQIKIDDSRCGDLLRLCRILLAQKEKEKLTEVKILHLYKCVTWVVKDINDNAKE